MQNGSSFLASLIIISNKKKLISKDDTLVQLSSNFIIFQLYSLFYQYNQRPYKYFAEG